MARTSTSRPQNQPLAPKPRPDSDISALSSQPNTPSQHSVFDDSAAGSPVTMPDEPYRSLAQRIDSQSNQLTVEQLVDTRLCVSSLSAQECREVLGQLDDCQIKNAVYDRALCFPSDQWTQNIRAMYGRQVQHDSQAVLSFENVTNHMENVFNSWRNVSSFEEDHFHDFEAHIKSFLGPSIDNVGVYGTFSNYTVTKINALSALVKIGQMIMDLPILTSKRGVSLFVYDPLSRAVGNILSTTPNHAARSQILDLALEGEFVELTKRATAVGLFPGLLQALAPGSQVYPYNVPSGDRLIPYSNKRQSTGELSPMAKKSKLATGGQYTGQATLDKDGAPTPGSSRGSSYQPQEAIGGLAAEPSGPRNPFSRAPSAGPVAMPPFANSASSTPAAKIKVEDAHAKQEHALNQDAELQGLARSATEYQPKGQQPPAEGQPGQEAAQKTDAEQANGAAYDDLLRRIENELFHAHANEAPEAQLKRAPGVVALVEGTAGTILKRFQAAARACEAKGRRDHFLASLNDTAFALLWVVESCALNVAGTTLGAEVSRCLSRDALVGGLWGSVRLANPTECLGLLAVKDHMGSETFGEKLERIIKQLDETGAAGFGDLRFVLGNMRSGISVPVHNPKPKPDPSQT